MPTPVTLADQRLISAELTSGTSDGSVKEMVLRMMRRHGLGGRVLDFGAGQGELLMLLTARGLASEMWGADIMGKPVHLPESVLWITQDLNSPLKLRKEERFDLVISSEVIEHLENPRGTFRNFYGLLKPGGYLLLTTPNQESLRSILALILKGHFVQFLGSNYPKHITALLRMDLEWICRETGFEKPEFHFNDLGKLPGLPTRTWQQIGFGLLKGRHFSDNLGLVARKPPS